MMAFDPDTFDFLETLESNSTVRIPVPEFPDGVTLVCKDALKPKQIISKKSGDTFWVAELVFLVDSDEARSVTGMKEPQIRHGMFLEFTPEGNLDMGRGRNVQLGQARDAMGLNEAGKPFKYKDFVGRVCKGIIKHDIEDDRTSPRYGEKQAKITRLGKQGETFGRA